MSENNNFRNSSNSDYENFQEPENSQYSQYGSQNFNNDIEPSSQGQNKISRMFGTGYQGSRIPYVTYTIIVLCSIIYVVQFISQMAQRDITPWISFIPMIAPHEPWRILTSAFAHGSWIHILSNMYALWIVGRELENTIGKLKYIGLYLLSAVGGSIAVEAFSEPLGQTVGASGAIFGLFGALFIIQRANGEAITQIFSLIGLNLVISFIQPGISWQGHIGGLVTGLVVSGLIVLLRLYSAFLWISFVLIAAILLLLYVYIAAVKGYGEVPVHYAD